MLPSAQVLPSDTRILWPGPTLQPSGAQGEGRSESHPRSLGLSLGFSTRFLLVAVQLVALAATLLIPWEELE